VYPGILADLLATVAPGTRSGQGNNERAEQVGAAAAGLDFAQFLMPVLGVPLEKSAAAFIQSRGGKADPPRFPISRFQMRSGSIYGGNTSVTDVLLSQASQSPVLSASGSRRPACGPDARNSDRVEWERLVAGFRSCSRSCSGPGVIPAMGSGGGPMDTERVGRASLTLLDTEALGLANRTTVQTIQASRYIDGADQGPLNEISGDRIDSGTGHARAMASLYRLHPSGEPSTDAPQLTLPEGVHNHDGNARSEAVRLETIGLGRLHLPGLAELPAERRTPSGMERVPVVESLPAGTVIEEADIPLAGFRSYSKPEVITLMGSSPARVETEDCVVIQRDPSRNIHEPTGPSAQQTNLHDTQSLPVRPAARPSVPTQASASVPMPGGSSVREDVPRWLFAGGPGAEAEAYDPALKVRWQLGDGSRVYRIGDGEAGDGESADRFIPFTFKAQTAVRYVGQASGNEPPAAASDTTLPNILARHRAEVDGGNLIRPTDGHEVCWADRAMAPVELADIAFGERHIALATSEAVFSAVADEAATAKAKGSHQVRLEVRTDQGDVVRVRMAVNSNVVTAKISVSSVGMKELLASRVWELSQRLEMEGLVAEDIEFCLLGESDQHSHRQGARRFRKRIQNLDTSEESGNLTLIGVAANTFDRWA
jgi:hypothetical protein